MPFCEPLARPWGTRVCDDPGLGIALERPNRRSANPHVVGQPLVERPGTHRFLTPLFVVLRLVDACIAQERQTWQGGPCGVLEKSS